jgi:hypothetical protein
MLHICAIVLVSQKKKLGFHKKALIKGLRECRSLRDKEWQVVQEILSRSVCASADRTARVEESDLRSPVNGVEWRWYEGAQEKNSGVFFPYL